MKKYTHLNDYDNVETALWGFFVGVVVGLIIAGIIGLFI